ncbi:MAG: hypothetical protein MZV63_38240 [Marinilabiliales bacterium]|nr:hypothetical protein [Marinilabiliales bacterium]
MTDQGSGAFLSRTDEGLPERITPLTLFIRNRKMIERMYFTINIQFPYSSGYQLSVLRSEIEYKNFFLQGSDYLILNDGSKIDILLLAIVQYSPYRIALVHQLPEKYREISSLPLQPVAEIFLYRAEKWPIIKASGTRL